MVYIVYIPCMVHIYMYMYISYTKYGIYIYTSAALQCGVKGQWALAFPRPGAPYCKDYINYIINIWLYDCTIFFCDMLQFDLVCNIRLCAQALGPCSRCIYRKWSHHYTNFIQQCMYNILQYNARRRWVACCRRLKHQWSYDYCNII